MHASPALRSFPLFLVALSATVHAAAQAPAAGNVDRGKALFQLNCAVCHATGLATATVAGQGPQLAGVVGRVAATQPGFGFTKALEASHLTWDATTLDKFLTAPPTFVPGTN